MWQLKEYWELNKSGESHKLRLIRAKIKARKLSNEMNLDLASEYKNIKSFYKEVYIENMENK